MPRPSPVLHLDKRSSLPASLQFLSPRTRRDLTSQRASPPLFHHPCAGYALRYLPQSPPRVYVQDARAQLQPLSRDLDHQPRGVRPQEYHTASHAREDRPMGRPERELPRAVQRYPSAEPRRYRAGKQPRTWLSWTLRNDTIVCGSMSICMSGTRAILHVASVTRHSRRRKHALTGLLCRMRRSAALPVSSCAGRAPLGVRCIQEMVV